MVWFKTDDKFPDHRKARAVRRSSRHKTRDSAPFGIWVQAGAWSDDGFVPLEVLLDWDDDAEELARRLVDAGLWREVTQAGERGYEFHDWADYLPRPDGVTDASESGRRGNHVRWHVQHKRYDPTCEWCAPASPDHRGDDRPDSGGESDRVSRTRPVPTRPDPTNNPSPDGSDTDRFEEFWQTYDHKVSRKKAETAYRAALKKPGVTEDLLISAAAAYIDYQRREGKHPTYTKHPTTWLHQECWRDERTPQGDGRQAMHDRQMERAIQREREMGLRE